jgi:peptide/nickel transport system permease protein
MQHSLQTLIFTIGLLYFPQFARVTYGVAASLRTKDYVLAAEALGACGPRIIFQEILPNMMSVVIVQISFTMSFAMLLEAGLSFLGLGVMPPQPSWGQMAGALKDFIFLNPWPVVFPSAVLFLAVFSINMIGDWLQDYLNPEIVR